MGEIKSEQDIKQYLGDHFVEKREFFVETGDFIQNLKLKYNWHVGLIINYFNEEDLQNTVGIRNPYIRIPSITRLLQFW